MSYDLYVERPRGDVATQIRLLVTREDRSLNTKEFVRLVHAKTDTRTKQLQRGEFSRMVKEELDRLQELGLKTPGVENFGHFPRGSWFLQFTFTLVKPWISKDDAPFYVAESVNPVRKDKVFKVPFVSAAAWKGLLRWTAMHIRLALRKEQLGPTKFAQERFVQTLLFGDEKGEEPGKTKDFTAHVDLLKPDARQEYEHLLRTYYGLEEKDALPHHSSRLLFYPTFFDKIDVEVINPHSRQTKAGTHPIYLECAPAGAQGTFSLLYVPFDLIGQPGETVRAQAQADLHLVAEAVSAMMLTYGFSAKRTSGYGTAEDETKGMAKTRADEKPLTRLTQLAQEVANVGF